MTSSLVFIHDGRFALSTQATGFELLELWDHLDDFGYKQLAGISQN